MTLATLFEPIQVGTMALAHRIVVPPHGGGNGSLVGTDDQFEVHCAYWLARVQGGVQWIGGAPSFVRHPVVPGFEPTGIGANAPGLFRHPRYPERLARYVERVHAAGGFASVQMVLQGGMPSAPSATLSGYNDHRVPHVLDLDEVTWLVREYGESAAIAAEAGTDAIELHANHDDLLQWFLSPLTNRRTDGYGGSFEGRRRFLREVVEAIRSAVGRPITLGLRLCLDEMIEGGYGVDECGRLLAAFEADGTVDYFSLDAGGNWGRVTYIPHGSFPEASWAELCGHARRSTSLPVVYVGRVVHLDVAEAVLTDGHADLVGMARANIADPELVNKARRSRLDTIRPCIGINDCIHRRIVEGLPFGCAANPQAGRENETVPARAVQPRSLLVVGGGPAGMELAALAAGHGHAVAIWERSDDLGGALATAARARMNGHYRDWIEWQRHRLDELGVKVEFGRDASADDILAAGAEVVAVATGATSRRPEVAGVDLPHVHVATDVLDDRVAVGRRVLLVAEDDFIAPLAVADHLAAAGHEVTFVYGTPGPAPLVGKYSLGMMMASLDEAGVALVPMARVAGISADGVQLAHVYSDRSWTVDGIDTVVLACGSVPNDQLYQSLKGRHPAVHILGDAFAPRRLTFATRQAWELAAVLAG